MTILTKALSAIGLMRASEHEREIEVLKDILEETRAAELLYLNKFKKAVADLAAASDEMEGLKLDNADLRQQITTLHPDATLWRNARDKRAKNRGGK